MTTAPTLSSASDCDAGTYGSWGESIGRIWRENVRLSGMAMRAVSTIVLGAGHLYVIEPLGMQEQPRGSIAAARAREEPVLIGMNQKNPSQEQHVTRVSIVATSVGLLAGLALPVRAQPGMEMFQKKGISGFFKPVVGHGAVYEEQRNGRKQSSEMLIVGKESVEGKDGYWMEAGMADKERGGTVYAKVLVTPTDFQFHRTISQMPGKQPVEYTFPTSSRKPKLDSELDKWHKVGTESITVPAGTFSCEHWTKNDGKSDIWMSTQVTPIGLVKEVAPERTTVLVKVITDAKDHITGTPQKFDIEAMKQQMMEQMQKKKP